MIKQKLNFSVKINSKDVTIATGTKKVVDYITSDEEELRNIVIGISAIGHIQELCFIGGGAIFKSVITDNECVLEWEYSADVNMGTIYLPVPKNYDSTVELDHEKLLSTLAVDINLDGNIEVFNFKTMFPEVADRLLNTKLL